MLAIVLAGGASRRMGAEKAFLRIDGLPLIQRVLQRLKSTGIFEDLVVVTNHPRRFSRLGVRVVKDKLRDKGPLGGIYTGLLCSGSLYNFFVGCDMPFLNTRLIKFMVDKLPQCDIFTPKTPLFQTLHTIYSKRCIDPIAQMIGSGDLRIIGLFEKVCVRELSLEIIKGLDPYLLSFFNINTPSDYRTGLRIAKDGTY
jgi:molybdopterin-guanine dinucleotide biosynthesis protein A